MTEELQQLVKKSSGKNNIDMIELIDSKTNECYGAVNLLYGENRALMN